MQGLHRTDLQGLRRVKSLHQNLLMREIKQHRRNIYQIEATYLQKTEYFVQDLGLISKLYVRRFLRAVKKMSSTQQQVSTSRNSVV